MADPDSIIRSERLDEALFVSSEGQPTRDGAMRYVSDAFRFKDGIGVFNPRFDVNTVEHKIVRHLIHFIDDGPADGFVSGAYKEILPAGNPFPTQAIWWESAAKLKKIVEFNMTRDSQKKPATEEWKMYATDGTTVLCTVTDTITYSGVQESTRTRVVS